jgi:hypothetical protein
MPKRNKMDKITNKIRKEYLENFGTECPFCESDNISSVEWDYGTGEVWAKVRCYDCKEVWTDVYKLTGIEEYK